MTNLAITVAGFALGGIVPTMVLRVSIWRAKSRIARDAADAAARQLEYEHNVMRWFSRTGGF